ncbi:MAG: cadherin repeat domain-containing protein [Planctomycetaceae bacterium]|jgi:hypothetical protein|nr:cadherin repeat domain-containing protein [Planctomycetaceae bacterium]
MPIDVSLFRKITNLLFDTTQRKEPVKRRGLRFESLENRELLSVSPLLPSLFSSHEYSASQAFVTDNFDMMSSSATSFTNSYPTPESCFVLLGGSSSIVSCAGCDEDISELVVFQGIDGTATIMSYTCMAAMSIDSGEEYWNKTYSENRWETWVWTIPDGVSNTDALRDFTFTGTTCCGEMSANVHICMVPEFISDVDEELSDPLTKNVDYYSHYILADADSGETTTGKTIEAEYIHNVTYSLVRQKDAYGNDVEIFDFDDGVITTAVSLADEENLTDTYTLIVKASDSYHSDLPEQYDLATVTISLVDINFIPYTPETKYIDPMVIPEDNWKENEVGIRRNGDYDDGNASRDWWSGTASAAENDLIRLDIDIIPASGIEYRLKTTDSQPSVRLWNSKLKGGNPISTTGNGTLITSDKTVYAEYISSGDNHVTFELVAIISATGQEFYSEEIVFRPFESITVAFVGENQTAGNPTISPGVNDWVIQELLNGYDVHVWDDGHDVLANSGDCDEWGEGNALNEVANAVNSGVTEVAIIGYSHGGGSTYNLAWRMFYDGMTSDNSLYWYPPQVINQPYSLVFTSYIDAVQNASFFNPFSEFRRPLGSQFHLNQYQTNGWTYQSTYLSGTATVGGTTSNTINIAYPSLIHSTIDDDTTVLETLTQNFESKVTK